MKKVGGSSLARSVLWRSGQENKQDENDLLAGRGGSRGTSALQPESDIVTHNLHQQMMMGHPRSTR